MDDNKQEIRLYPIGETFVTGLSSSYDDTYPEECSNVLSEEEFDSAMKKINEALMDHWPCLPCSGFAYGCCICTMGLSLLCSSSMVSEAEDRCNFQINRINNQLREKEVEFRLIRSAFPRRSWIQLTLPITTASV